MSDIHALSGAYAVDALDEHERRQFERHLAECAECRAEVDSLREASATLTEISSTPPPAALRSSVLSAISTVRPLPPETRTEPLLRRRWPLVGAAAAAVALLGSLVVAQPWSDDAEDLTAAELVVQADDVRSLTVEMVPPEEPGSFAGPEATVYLSESRGQAAIVTADGSERLLPDGKVFELWLQKDGEMVPAGLFTEADDPVLLDGELDNAVAAGITIEPAAGSTQPTSAPVALFRFERAT